MHKLHLLLFAADSNVTVSLPKIKSITAQWSARKCCKANLSGSVLLAIWLYVLEEPFQLFGCAQAIELPVLADTDR
ncbi:hypothetical protein IFU12_07505 [Pseudomonas coleopterorum]|nr:hypothetical protein [Pseudomonas coleopterorum]